MDRLDDITRLIEHVQEGDARAGDRLLEAVYDELRALAAARLRREKPGQTLQPTALVHEAYLRLIGNNGKGVEWSGRAHFFAAGRGGRRAGVDEWPDDAKPVILRPLRAMSFASLARGVIKMADILRISNDSLGLNGAVSR